MFKNIKQCLNEHNNIVSSTSSFKANKLRESGKWPSMRDILLHLVIFGYKKNTLQEGISVNVPFNNKEESMERKVRTQSLVDNLSQVYFLLRVLVSVTYSH